MTFCFEATPQVNCVGSTLSFSQRNVGGEGETVTPPLEVLPHLLHGCLVLGLVHEADPHVGCAALLSTGILVLLGIKCTRFQMSLVADDIRMEALGTDFDFRD